VRAEVVIAQVLKGSPMGFQVLIIFGNENIFVGKTAPCAKERCLKALVSVIDDVRDRQIKTVALRPDALDQLFL
jgi:ribosomal protein S5